MRVNRWMWATVAAVTLRTMAVAAATPAPTTCLVSVVSRQPDAKHQVIRIAANGPIAFRVASSTGTDASIYVYGVGLGAAQPVYTFPFGTLKVSSKSGRLILALKLTPAVPYAIRLGPSANILEIALTR